MGSNGSPPPPPNRRGYLVPPTTETPAPADMKTGSATVARIDGTRAGQWESRAALIADLAAAHELPDRVEGWESMPTEVRSQLLGGLRIFLEDCPDCGGPVLAGRETVTSCCRSHEVVAASCEECGARLLELPYEDVAA